MGIARQSAEFVTDRCLCSEIFKGPNGRHEFNLHALGCKDQLALRVASMPKIEMPSTIGMDAKTLDALDNISKQFNEAAKILQEKKK